MEESSFRSVRTLLASNVLNVLGTAGGLPISGAVGDGAPISGVTVGNDAMADL